jgi:hypothetical protein
MRKTAASVPKPIGTPFFVSFGESLFNFLPIARALGTTIAG